MLRHYQVDLVSEIDRAWSDGHRNVFVYAPTGAGKCLGIGTKVLRFNGLLANVEDIVAGDSLMGWDGTPRPVKSVCRDRGPLYRITPVKGDPWVCNDAHVLTCVNTESDKIIDIPLNEYLLKNKWFKHTHKQFSKETETGFVVQDDLPIDPYFLGVWFGDGNHHLRGIGICKNDIEITRLCEETAAAWGLHVRIDDTKARLHYLEGRKKLANPLVVALRKLTRGDAKTIPWIVCTSSIAERRQFLAGLIDTDGHASKAGVEFTQKHGGIFWPAIFIARSLGLKAVTSVKIVDGKPYFQSYLSGDFSKIPLRIERKIPQVRTINKSVGRTGFSVEAIGEGEYAGFELGGDGRFLLGDFTITHNTVVFSYLISRESGVCLAMAHRRELIGQMSMQLARNGVRHRVIGPKPLIQKIVRMHMRELGRSFYDPSGRACVASVDSIKLDDPLLKQVILVIPDEGHHVLRENKWGKVLAVMNPQARMVLPSATIFRSDGKGLGRHADGVGDVIVYGPSLRDLIQQGYLLDYRIIMPVSDYERPSESDVGPSGEIRPEAARASVHRSKKIVGDIVQWYCDSAMGKLGLTFAVDIESAQQIVAAYKAAGVPAELVTGNTDPDYRDAVFDRFERREVWQIVNVGIAGEGTDIPGVEVVSMGAPTESKGWFDQMFGRALRLLITREQMAAWDSYSVAERLAILAASPKPKALIIDHCGNVMRHLPPDAPRVHTLDRRDRRVKSGPSDVIPLRLCLTCVHPTPRHLRGCAHCKDRPAISGGMARHLTECEHCRNSAPAPAGRSRPDEVDGDPFELDEAALRALRGEIAAIDELPVLYGPEIGRRSMMQRHNDRFVAQQALRQTLEAWRAYWAVGGRDESEIYRRFYFQFGVDYLTAQTLGAREADDLRERVTAKLPGESDGS